DALLALVPEHRHRYPAGVARVVLLVALVQETEVVQRVAGGSGRAVEGPAVLAHQPAHHRDLDQRLQPLEAPGDQGAVRPGAGQADIQVVASRFGREAAGSGGARGTIRGDPVAMLRGFALETAVPGGVIPLVMPAAVN